MGESPGELYINLMEMPGPHYLDAESRNDLIQSMEYSSPPVRSISKGSTSILHMSKRFLGVSHSSGLHL